MTNLFEAKLSDQSIANLRKLLGETVFRIYSPMLEVKGTIVTTTHGFSLHIERKGYVAITNLRIESENDWIDYYQLSAEFLANPKHYTDIEIKNGLKYFKSPISTIELFPSESFEPSPIAKMSVYEEEDSFVDNICDVVRYDKAVVFQCENGRKFCISVSTIPEMLDFTDSDPIVETTIKNCKLRLEIL